MSDWVRREPAVSTGIDWGGDVQVGDAFDARWTRSLDDGLTAMVSRTYYAIVPDQPGPRVREMERCDEYLVCTDPSDPGGTEEWAEYRYRQVYGYSPTDEGAERAAHATHEPSDAEWNRNAPAYPVAPDNWSNDAQRRQVADDDVDGWG